MGKAKCVLTGSEGWRHGCTSAGDGCEAGTWAEPAAEAWIILDREGNVNEGKRQWPWLKLCELGGRCHTETTLRKGRWASSCGLNIQVNIPTVTIT